MPVQHHTLRIPIYELLLNLINFCSFLVPEEFCGGKVVQPQYSPINPGCKTASMRLDERPA
jgi:hypothetical protein